MLYWSLTFLFVALSAGLLVITFTAAGARKILPGPDPDTHWDSATYIPTWLRSFRVRALVLTRRIRRTRLGRLNWRRGVRYFAICIIVITAAFVSVGVHHIYFDRTNLPDIEPLARFEFPTIGIVYDANGLPLIEMAKEYRRITQYEDIPSVVRNAIIAAEDKNFFSHSGVDYSAIPRVLGKFRVGALVARFIRQQDEVDSSAIFPQGGSTITQQLVRGHFLKTLTARENSSQLRPGGLLPRTLSEIRMKLNLKNKNKKRSNY